MKLKSYLRGIGAGMIVAALIMGVAAPKGNAQTPEPEQKQTLLEAVKDVSVDENVVVKEDKKDTSESISGGEGVSVVSVDTPASTETVTDSDTTSSEEDKTEFVETPEPEPEPLPEPEGPPAIDPMPEDETGYVSNGETVLIKVIKGDSSVSVSRRIFEAGLVESAVELDRYLCDNHYDKSISVGEYEIAVGSDFETI
ncbi:MAG: hypothetical protein IKZ39_04400, partial [Lachnospiraceae bacterium]|nr:hypothetical protein [Lachnospiraceae bacterium]